MALIVVDGNELNLSVPVTDKERFDKLTTNEKWVIEKFQELKQLKKIRIIDRKALDKMQMAIKPKLGFDLSADRINPETGSKEKWIYCENKAIIKNGVKTYPVKHISHFWHSGVEFTSVDMMFFLLYIMNVKKFNLVVEDREAEATARINKERNKSKVEDWIYNRLLDKEVEPICLRWGISIEEKSVSELRVELIELISRNEKIQGSKRGFKTFLDEMNSQSEVVKIGSYVNNAIQKKQIAFNPTKRSFFWADSSETIGGVIPPARMNDKEEYLIQYLLTNQDERELFLASVTDDKLIAMNEDYMLVPHVKTLQSMAKTKFGETFPNTMKLVEAREWYKQKLEESTVETT